MSWNKSKEVWSNPNLLFVWFYVFVTVAVVVAKTPYFLSGRGTWSKMMSCCVQSLIVWLFFPLIPNIVLVKMNEHWTKRTYENYTFQPLMSFWLAMIVFFFFWLKKVLQATLTNLAKNNKLKCLLMYNKNLNYAYLYMHSHHWRQKARLSGNENQFQISSEVFEFHASFWPEIFSVLVRVQRTQELSQFC